jgi:HD-like signal output (HDOD) protein
MMDRSLESISTLLSDLQIRPALDARVLEAAASADHADKFERLSALLSADPLLAVRVLRVANSAFFGRHRNVASIGAALGVLGTDAVAAIALASSFDGAFEAVAADRAALDTLRRHSLWTAVIARRVAQAGRLGTCSGEDAFIVGLMHDLGSLIQLQAACNDTTAPLADVDHAVLGAALLHGWGLPQMLIDAVLVHHDATAALGGREVRAVLWAANALASCVSRDGGDEPADVPATVLEELLGLDETGLKELAGQAARDARAIEELVR